MQIEWFVVVTVLGEAQHQLLGGQSAFAFVHVLIVRTVQYEFLTELRSIDEPVDIFVGNFITININYNVRSLVVVPMVHGCFIYPQQICTPRQRVDNVLGLCMLPLSFRSQNSALFASLQTA